MRTTNEPGRRQNSEVSNPNRPTSARHLLRTHIRSHGTKLDRNILETTAGATGLLQRKLRAQRGPTQRWSQKELRPHSLSGFIWKHIERIHHLDRSHPYTYKLKFASTFSSPWGSPKQASGNPKFRGLTRKAHRELKGMIFRYSQFFR